MAKYVESERDVELANVLANADSGALCVLANKALGNLCVRYNAGWRPGGSKNPIRRKQLSRKQEQQIHNRLRAKSKSSDVPLLDAYRETDGLWTGEAVSAMECLFWELVSDGTLRQEQAEYGVVHGYRRIVRRSFMRIVRRAERDKLRKMSSIETKVSYSEDGLPEVYGGQWAEDEQYIGKQTAEDNRMLLAEHIVKAVEDKVVDFLSKQKKGKRLLAVASLLAQGLSNRRICAVLRENGTKVSNKTTDRLVVAVHEAYLRARVAYVDSLPDDTDYDPACERIARADQRRIGIGQSIRRELEFNEVRAPQRWTFTAYPDPPSTPIVSACVPFGNAVSTPKEIGTSEPVPDMLSSSFWTPADVAPYQKARMGQRYAAS